MKVGANVRLVGAAAYKFRDSKQVNKLLAEAKQQHDECMANNDGYGAPPAPTYGDIMLSLLRTIVYYMTFKRFCKPEEDLDLIAAGASSEICVDAAADVESDVDHEEDADRDMDDGIAAAPTAVPVAPGATLAGVVPVPAVSPTVAPVSTGSAPAAAVADDVTVAAVAAPKQGRLSRALTWLWSVVSDNAVPGHDDEDECGFSFGSIPRSEI